MGNGNEELQTENNRKLQRVQAKLKKQLSITAEDLPSLVLSRQSGSIKICRGDIMNSVRLNKLKKKDYHLQVLLNVLELIIVSKRLMIMARIVFHIFNASDSKLY